MVHSSIATALLLLAQIDNGSAQTCTYTLSSGILSWSDAKAACQSVGKQLASVQSAAQNALLRSKASGVGCWIGGTDPVYEGAWVWSPSNSPISYTNWANGEPGGGFCMAIQGDGYWNGADCASRKRYLCQSCTASGTICSNAPTVCDGTYSGSELCAPPPAECYALRCALRPPPVSLRGILPGRKGERARLPCGSTPVTPSHLPLVPSRSQAQATGKDVRVVASWPEWHPAHAARRPHRADRSVRPPRSAATLTTAWGGSGVGGGARWRCV